jgi:hypothetical protein
MTEAARPNPLEEVRYMYPFSNVSYPGCSTAGQKNA